MTVIPWSDKFFDTWKYKSTIDLGEYFEYLKERIVSGDFTLVEVDCGHLVLWNEYVGEERCLWIEFGFGEGLSECVERIILHAKSHGYDVIRTNVERVGAKVLYEKQGFNLTHYMMERKV